MSSISKPGLGFELHIIREVYPYMETQKCDKSYMSHTIIMYACTLYTQMLKFISMDYTILRSCKFEDLLYSNPQA